MSERFVSNPNPPKIRFIRKQGRIIPICPKGACSKQRINARKARRLLREQLDIMRTKVDIAEKGERVHLGYGTSHEVRGFKSTFPKFYGELGFRNKDDFRKVLQKPGVRQERLMERAIEDLKAGKDYGFGLPNTRGVEFKVAVRSMYDNQGVIFRKIKGKVRPIRVEKQTPYQEKDIGASAEPFL